MRGETLWFKSLVVEAVDPTLKLRIIVDAVLPTNACPPLSGKPTWKK